MEIGISVRSMGPQSRAEVLLPCVQAAEAAGFAHVWVQDHIAIPPDDAEGSGGRYLDPLSTLAWLAGKTERIGLGVGVLILPYRRALPTAKTVATIQELSGGRLHLGVGIGWMDPEFRALGLSRSDRGRASDATLDFLQRAFAGDVVEEHGQEFLFLPRPERPPIYVGGHGEHALRRTARFGDYWLPMGAKPDQLASAKRRLAELAEEHQRPEAGICTFTAFDPRAPEKIPEQLGTLGEAGVTRLIAATGRYEDPDEYRRSVDFLSEHALRPLAG